jgi:hypothetical protein
MSKIDEMYEKISTLEDAASIVGEELAKKLLEEERRERLQKSDLDHHVDNGMILKARRQKARQDQVAALIALLARLIAADPVGAQMVIDNYLVAGSRGTNPPRAVGLPTVAELEQARARILKQWMPSGPMQRAAFQVFGVQR